MRPTDVIIRETYEQNRRVFSDKDRANARTAWNIYMFEINGAAGLRCEFDYYPHDIEELSNRYQRDLSKLKYLRARVKRFGDFIELLEGLDGRDAVQINPMWWKSDNATETITRTLEPETIPVYRDFHKALTAYVDELGKKKLDLVKVAELARQVAYVVNPEAWREAGIPVSGCGVTCLGTRWYLASILSEPRDFTG